MSPPEAPSSGRCARKKKIPKKQLRTPLPFQEGTRPKASSRGSRKQSPRTRVVCFENRPNGASSRPAAYRHCFPARSRSPHPGCRPTSFPLALPRSKIKAGGYLSRSRERHGRSRSVCRYQLFRTARMMAPQPNPGQKPLTRMGLVPRPLLDSNEFILRSRRAANNARLGRAFSLPSIQFGLPIRVLPGFSFCPLPSCYSRARFRPPNALAAVALSASKKPSVTHAAFAARERARQKPLFYSCSGRSLPFPFPSSFSLRSSRAPHDKRHRRSRWVVLAGAQFCGARRRMRDDHPVRGFPISKERA